MYVADPNPRTHPDLIGMRSLRTMALRRPSDGMHSASNIPAQGGPVGPTRALAVSLCHHRPRPLRSDAGGRTVALVVLVEADDLHQHDLAAPAHRPQPRATREYRTCSNVSLTA